MITLTKRFDFEAAHRLVKGYKGKCNNIHGHSWRGEVSVSITELDRYDMGVDFAEMKGWYKDIITAWDHSILLANTDVDLIDFCERVESNYHVFSGNPTSEVLAMFLYRHIREHIKNHPVTMTLNYVKIEETCTSECYFYG